MGTCSLIDLTCVSFLPECRIVAWRFRLTHWFCYLAFFFQTSIVNKHLSTLMTGLSAKVFRTYNASHTMEQELENTPADGTVAEKILAYNRANRKVAVLCNHQKAVGKGHQASMEKLGDKVRLGSSSSLRSHPNGSLLGLMHLAVHLSQVRALKYQRMKLRHQLHHLEPKTKKKGKYAEDESDLEDEWIESHEEELQLKAVEAAKKKFEKVRRLPLLLHPDSRSLIAFPFSQMLTRRLPFLSFSDAFYLSCVFICESGQRKEASGRQGLGRRERAREEHQDHRKGVERDQGGDLREVCRAQGQGGDEGEARGEDREDRPEDRVRTFLRPSLRFRTALALFALSRRHTHDPFFIFFYQCCQDDRHRPKRRS
jgi:hypothetical protein